MPRPGQSGRKAIRRRSPVSTPRPRSTARRATLPRAAARSRPLQGTLSRLRFGDTAYDRGGNVLTSHRPKFIKRSEVEAAIGESQDGYVFSGCARLLPWRCGSADERCGVASRIVRAGCRGATEPTASGDADAAVMAARWCARASLRAGSFFFFGRVHFSLALQKAFVIV